jgi:hypothetical protein
MISKQLLSEVLKENCDHINFTPKGNISFYSHTTQSQELINQYELAHKCKDWALRQDYYFSIYSFNFSSNTEQEHRVRLLIGNEVVYWGNDSNDETEVEAIFLDLY